MSLEFRSSRFSCFRITSREGKHISCVAWPNSFLYPRHWGAANRFGLVLMCSHALTWRKNFIRILKEKGNLQVFIVKRLDCRITLKAGKSSVEKWTLKIKNTQFLKNVVPQPQRELEQTAESVWFLARLSQTKTTLTLVVHSTSSVPVATDYSKNCVTILMCFILHRILPTIKGKPTGLCFIYILFDKCILTNKTSYYIHRKF